MPGYEPFLLCDFHVHTQWSDGKLSVGEVVDLYGSTGKFDVIAITDHILMKKDMLARARLATLGRRAFGVREDDFDAYLADVGRGAAGARQYGMLVIPGAGITRTGCTAGRVASSRWTSKCISADQRADEI
jgi:histidinol phosphatase-like PHP family hydrolase